MKLEEENLKYTIKDMPFEERPQEKLFKYGSKALSNAELLALIIRTGDKNNTSVELAQRILNYASEGKNQNINSLVNLKKLTAKELMQIPGIGESKSAMIIAALALADRIKINPITDVKYILSPENAADILMENMRFLEKESFKIITLNTKKEIISMRTVSTGTINATIVHPRDVFNIALKDLAHSIIISHNHPSGDPSPSMDDIKITENLVEAGKIIKIEVIDHIIIGNNRYFSFLENKLI